MADLEHRTSRIVDQRPDVVHDRLLELAARLRDEAPPVEPGTQAATMLGTTGSLGIAVADRGPARIEIQSTRGRIRGHASADLAPTADRKTNVRLDVELVPHGFGAGMLLGVALAARPELERQLIDGLERAFDDLAEQLAKPDGQWDASAWRPPGLPG